MVLGHIVLFSWLTFRLYARFATQTFDLAIFDQAVWLISRGESPFLTTRGTHLLGDHFSAILYLAAPLYWVWPDPRMLLLAQSVALGTCAIPVFHLARLKLQSDGLALMFAAATLCHPSLQWLNAHEFHPEAFAVPLLFWVFLALYRQQWALYYALLAMTLLTKEIAGVSILLLGAVVLFERREVGLRTAALAGGGIIVALTVVRCFSGSSNGYWKFYEWMVSSPQSVIPTLFSTERASYVGDLLLPLAMLPLLRPAYMIPALPILLLNLLSMRSGMRQVNNHYGSFLLPFLVPAAIHGFARWKTLGNRLTTLSMAALLIAGTAYGLELGPLVGREYRLPGPMPEKRAQVVASLLATIPPASSVSAQVSLAAHLSRRRSLYIFPNPMLRASWGNTTTAIAQQHGALYPDWTVEKWETELLRRGPEYIVLDPTGQSFPLPMGNYVDAFDAVRRSRTYEQVAQGGGVVVYRRRLTPTP
jgi:uncharacterized membrane protein